MIVAGLVPRLALAEIIQERLGADGFPANWKPADFAIGKEIISGTTARVGASGSMPVPLPMVAVTPTAVRTVNSAALEGLGVLKLGSGGEAPDLWQKSGRADAEAGLGRAVAQGVASPALREAWRRVLLTEAAPPVAPDKAPRPSWLAVRADALQKLGLFEASWNLWREVPAEVVGDDSVALGWVQAKLLAGQGQESCAVAKSRAVAAQGGGDWPVVMAVCQLVGGGQNPAAASLSLQLVEPVLKAKNPTLFRILSAVLDGKPVTTLNTPHAMVDSLGGTVLSAYPALVGAEILPRLPDVTLRRLVASEALPADLRGRAAIALARQTGLPQDGAAAWQLVSNTEFSGTLPDAVVVARGVKEISGSAIGGYVQAALRLGMIDAAGKVAPQWAEVSGSSVVEKRERLQALLATAVLQGKVEDRLWDAWLLVQALENQQGVRAAQRTLLTVEGLGVGVPARVWQQMRDRAVPVSTLVDPAWQRLLAGAVTAQDIPGSLGLVSEAWVGQPPAGVVPVVMGASIEALRRAGMEDIARRVAAEAMMGIPDSHLIPLIQDVPGPVSATLPVQIGGEAMPAASPSTPVTATVPEMLPPPRVKPAAIRKPVVPMVKKPASPVVPKAGG